MGGEKSKATAMRPEERVKESSVGEEEDSHQGVVMWSCFPFPQLGK